MFILFRCTGLCLTAAPRPGTCRSSWRWPWVLTGCFAMNCKLILTRKLQCCPQTVECGAEDEGGQRDGGEPQHAEQHHQVRVSCSPLISSRYRVDIE